MGSSRAAARFLRWGATVALACLLGAGCKCGGGNGTFTPECGPDAGTCPAGYYCQSGLCLCAASDEVCDGADNDCDTQIDEMGEGGLVDVGGPCPGTQGECANGMVVCNAGALGCSVDPTAERCTNTDEDCNGMVDDGVASCACAPGGPGPSPEVCNGIDDDCNDAIDDGVPDCACAPGGAGPSAEVCNGIDDDCNEAIDDIPAGNPEVCNDADDDCDGVIDNGVPACACAPGGPGASAEVCNEIDDDCNEMIDEVNSLTGDACAQFGDPCAVNSDCSSQRCVGDVYDMYCTDECTMIGSPGDCPAGYRCWDNPSAAEPDTCRRNYVPCTRDSDCAPGEVCAITCDDPGTDAITECRQAIAGGAAAPAACTVDADCETYDCFRTGICTEVCASDADCAGGYRCLMLQTFQCGALDYVPRCLDACDCDSECPAGQACQPWVHVVPPTDTATTEGGCDIFYGGGDPGDACDITMAPVIGCTHSICSNAGVGYCTQVCSTTCGCPSPIGPCVATTVTFPDLGPYPAMTCDTL